MQSSYLKTGLNVLFVGAATPPGEDQYSYGAALGDLDGDGTVLTVDEYGLPNIDQDGLLPRMYVEPDGFLV